MRIIQRSAKWHELKRCLLGANDCASLLGHSYLTSDELIQHRIMFINPTPDPETQRLMDRGNRYEPVVRQLCSERHSPFVIQEMDAIRHPSRPWLMASPDGRFHLPVKPHQGDMRCQSRWRPPAELVEFKVVRSLSDEIPYKFYIQMQIQMEVCNLESCLYCENIIEESPVPYTERTGTVGTDGQCRYGQLLDEQGQIWYWCLRGFRESVVLRDRDWFANVLPTLEAGWTQICAGRLAQPVSARSRSRIYIDNLPTVEPVTAGMLSNYVRKEPLLDWLARYGDPSQRDTEYPTEISLLRRKQAQFRSLVRTAISQLAQTREILSVNVDPWPVEALQSQTVAVEPDRLKVTEASVNRTKELIAAKTPIIFNACFRCELEDYPYPVEGVADMLILNKHIDNLFDGEYSFADENLYSVVQCRYASLHLDATGTYLLNSGSQPVYKVETWLLNQLLAETAGQACASAFIVGRKYSWTCQRRQTVVEDCLAHLGVVDFSERDLKTVEIGTNALSWIARLRDDEFAEYDPMQPEVGGEIDEQCDLRPLKQNTHDYPWHQYKTTLLAATEDISGLYRCGHKVRQTLKRAGITRISEIEEEHLPFKTRKVEVETLDQDTGQLRAKPSTVDQIMAFKTGTPTVRAEPCSGTTCASEQWPAIPRHTVEFFVDCEAVSNLDDDFSRFPIVGSHQAIVYLIGVVVQINGPEAETHTYQSYLLTELTKEAEAENLARFLQDCVAVANRHGQTELPFYYWHAEPTIFRHMGLNERRCTELKIKWFDLCTYFRDNKIIYPGQQGYNLKTVAKAMFNQNLINTIWALNDTVVAGGLGGLAEAMAAYKWANRDPARFAQFKRTMLAYNQIDCKVLQEMLAALRRRAT